MEVKYANPVIQNAKLVLSAQQIALFVLHQLRYSKMENVLKTGNVYYLLFTQKLLVTVCLAFPTVKFAILQPNAINVSQIII